MSRVTEIACELLSFRTVSGEDSEEDLVCFVQSLMEKIGMRTQTHTVEEGRLAVIGRLEGRSERTLIINAHADVVPPGEGWSGDPFIPEIRGGMLYGRGSADMKGGLAAALCAVEQVFAQNETLGASIEIHVVPDEEVSGKGARYLVQKNLVKGDAAIFGEPTGLEVQIAEKGIAWIRIICRGKAAHASMPDRGENAIRKAAGIVMRLEKGFAEKVEGRRHRLLGTPTLNIGTIRGGTMVNTVPDECVISLDRRVLPGETEREVLSQIRNIVGDEAEVQLMSEIQQPCEISEKEKIVSVCRKAVATVLGIDVGVGGFPATTDARFYVNQGRVPSLILGPGNITEAHIANEFVAVDQLEKAASIYREIMRTF